MRRERETDRYEEAIVAFRNFTNAPKTLLNPTDNRIPFGGCLLHSVITTLTELHLSL